MKKILSESHRIDQINFDSLFEVYETNVPELETQIIGGMEADYTVSSTVYFFTVGVCGTFVVNGKTYEGFVSLGHNLSTGMEISVDEHVFGKPMFVRFYDKANGDFSFIRKTASSDTLSNKIYGSTTDYRDTLSERSMI